MKQQKSSDTYAVLSLIFGILSFCTGLFFIAGLFGIPGIILGVLSMRRENDRNKALAGIILASVGTATSVLMIFLLALSIISPAPPNNSKQETKTTEQIQPIKQPKTETAEEKAEKERNYWHKIVRVVDGDTIKASVDGQEESIRIIGINAPEYTSKKECFGKNATEHAKNLLKNGWVQLEQDDSQSNRDKYNRLLRYVWAGDGSVDFGHDMIADGYAYEYTYDIPYQKQASYKEAQKNAENDDKGLWSAKTCDGKKTKPVEKSTPAPSNTYTAPKTTTPAPQPSQISGVVKKSSSGICHAPGTTYYDRTTNYTGYSSLQACLSSGGRLPLR